MTGGLSHQDSHHHLLLSNCHTSFPEVGISKQQPAGLGCLHGRPSPVFLRYMAVAWLQVGGWEFEDVAL